MRCHIKKHERKCGHSEEGQIPLWAARSLRHVLGLLATLSSLKRGDR